MNVFVIDAGPVGLNAAYYGTNPVTSIGTSSEHSTFGLLQIG